LALGVRGQRVGAPMTHPLDVQADPQVLARLVATPAIPGLDQHGGGIPGLGIDRFDPSAQLARGPQRVDELEVVVGEQRRAERRKGVQDGSLDWVAVGSGSALWYTYLLNSNIRFSTFLPGLSQPEAKAAGRGPTRAGTQGMPRSVREQLILRVAGKVFADGGYERASMDRIASLAGVSKPMLYAYFGSKEGLYLAYIERNGGDLVQRLVNPKGTDTDQPLPPRLLLMINEF